MNIPVTNPGHLQQKWEIQFYVAMHVDFQIGEKQHLINTVKIKNFCNKKYVRK